MKTLFLARSKRQKWVGPYNDYFMKFYEAAKYYYTGGMHEPGGGLALGLNASWWGSLTDYERADLCSGYEEHAAAHDEAMAKNGQYLQKLIDEQGIQVRSFNEDVWDGFAEGAEEVFEETRDHSAMAAKIDDEFQAKLVKSVAQSRHSKASSLHSVTVSWVLAKTWSTRYRGPLGAPFHNPQGLSPFF